MSTVGTKRHPRTANARLPLGNPAPSVRDQSRAARPWEWYVSPCLWLLAAAALTIDLPVARFVQTHKTPGFVVDVLESAESFGNGAGVVLLLVAAYFLRTVGGGAMVRLSLVSLGSGLLADAFKLVIARTRPRNFDLHQGILESFGGWLPSANAHTAMQSFPSAHVATAVGLAYGLTYFYPRGKWVFASFTALVFFQRLQTGAHFVSDALAGMAVGWGVAVVLYRMPRVRSWFDSIESPPSAAENAAIPGPSNGR